MSVKVGDIVRVGGIHGIIERISSGIRSARRVKIRIIGRFGASKYGCVYKNVDSIAIEDDPHMIHKVKLRRSGNGNR